MLFYQLVQIFTLGFCWIRVLRKPSKFIREIWLAHCCHICSSCALSNERISSEGFRVHYRELLNVAGLPTGETLSFCLRVETLNLMLLPFSRRKTDFATNMCRTFFSIFGKAWLQKYAVSYVWRRQISLAVSKLLFLTAMHLLVHMKHGSYIDATRWRSSTWKFW